MAVAVVGGYKHLVVKLFFWQGVVPEFDYFKKFQVFDFLKSMRLREFRIEEEELWLCLFFC